MGYDTLFKLKAPIDKRFIGWMRDVKSDDIEEAKNMIRKPIRNFFNKKMGRAPVILPVFHLI